MLHAWVNGSVAGLILRVILVYFFALFAMRLMGKREIGKLSVFDLVISIMIAEVSAIALENPEAPMGRYLIIIIGLVLLQILMSFLTLKWAGLRTFIDGRPTKLIVNGKINEREMRRIRYSMTDLMTQLREKGMFNVADVEFAVLETSGKLSVYPKSEKRPLTSEDLGIPSSHSTLPVPLILEGKPIDQSLKRLNKSREWLHQQIIAQGYSDFKEIFYCSMDAKGQLYIDQVDLQDFQADIQSIEDL